MEESKNSPLVSVVLPIYKGEQHLKEAIQSILDQTFENFELILINDASPDHSKTVIESFDDQRIRYIENEVNLGLIGSLNKGIEAAKGKYIARMDQDDVSLPDRFEKQVNFLEKNPGYVICGMQGQILGKNERIGVPQKDEQIRALLFFGSPFIHPVVMLRKETLITNNLKYDYKYNHAEDFGLWMNLSFFGKMANLSEVGIQYRKHDYQYTKVYSEGNNNSAFITKLEYLKRLGLEINEEEKKIYSKLSRRIVSKEDINEMRNVSMFLKNIFQLSSKKGFDNNYFKNYIYRKWKVLCGERQKAGFSTYFLFLRGPFVMSFFEPKVHVWFIKKQLGF